MFNILNYKVLTNKYFRNKIKKDNPPQFFGEMALGVYVFNITNNLRLHLVLLDNVYQYFQYAIDNYTPNNHYNLKIWLTLVYYKIYNNIEIETIIDYPNYIPQIISDPIDRLFTELNNYNH
jgi:hypothetical protein